MDEEDTSRSVIPFVLSPYCLHRRRSLRTAWLNWIGISTFGDKPDLVGSDHLEPLFQHALDIVPPDAVQTTPIFLLATAGMRLLPEVARKELLAKVCSYARAHTKFLLPDCNLHIQVIPGETEGLYGWVAANYLLGGFDSPGEHAHGKGHHTYGFLDMGGASAQIAFAPNATEADKHAEDLKLLRMRAVNGAPMEYKVFVTTWLGFGVHEARRRYVEALLEASGTHDARELPDPCLPVGLSITTKGDVLLPGSGRVKGKTPYLIGTGRFDECLRQTYPLLDKDAPCENQPCLLNGVHVPAIDFDVNHFVGVSEYWHTTHEVFEMAYKIKAYDFNTYQARVKDFCSQDWKTISKGVGDSKWGKTINEATAAEVCFKASWLINVLHDGIGIPRVGLENTKIKGHNGTKEVLQHAKEKGFLDPFQAVDRIEDTEVSWTLGKMVLYAASQVPPVDKSLPVGFGSNVPGIPPDFQYAGSRFAPSPNASSSADDATDDDGGDDWHDTLFDSAPSRRIPGFLIFLIIICIAVFLLCGRDRRTRIYRKFVSPFRSNRGGATNRKRKLFNGKLPFFSTQSGPNYERVLEDGSSAHHDFELGTVDADNSDDNEHSDSSEGSRAGRTSGWATPRVKINGFDNGSGGYFDNIVSQGVGLGLTTPGLSANAMDRSGLVVRTDSRERLGPLGTGVGVGGVAGAVGGRRSRAGSPIRFKSPLMTPLAED